jgi:hypothetical protein
MPRPDLHRLAEVFEVCPVARPAPLSPENVCWDSLENGQDSLTTFA